MATLTALASSNTGSTFNSLTNISNAYTNSSSTTYAQLNTPTRTTGTYTIYFTGFDFSSIPQNVSIDNISLKYKGRINSTNYMSSASVQIAKGTQLIGSSQSLYTTSIVTRTLTSENWSRDDLNDFRVKVSATRSRNTNNAAYVYAYGMDVTITYTEIATKEQLKIKINGNWSDVAKVYKKVNGVWVEQSDLAELFNTSTKYVKAN